MMQGSNMCIHGKLGLTVFMLWLDTFLLFDRFSAVILYLSFHGELFAKVPRVFLAALCSKEIERAGTS